MGKRKHYSLYSKSRASLAETEEHLFSSTDMRAMAYLSGEWKM